MSDQKDLYVERKFTECFPNLNQLSHDKFSQSVTSRPDDIPRLERLFTYLGRLIDLHEHPNTLVLGCGLYPQPARILINKDFKVVCVEPVRSFVETAREYLGNSAKVLEGAAESIPLPEARFSSSHPTKPMVAVLGSHSNWARYIYAKSKIWFPVSTFRLNIYSYCNSSDIYREQE